MKCRVLCGLLTSFLFMTPCTTESYAQQGFLRQRIRQRIQQNLRSSIPAARATRDSFEAKTTRLANLNVAIWEPATYPNGGAPLVVFSHGFHGINTQTAFLMKELAKNGYLVIAPNHKDALSGGHALSRPDERLGDTSAWSDQTHRDRQIDIWNLLEALHKLPQWNSKIDWSQLALAGHSLGGYTALGCAGAWSTWKIPDVKVVLALSPYCQPFAKHKTLSKLTVPVMYQSGTRDLGVLPFIKRPNGAFDQTPSPAYLVVLDKAGHFSFSTLNHDQRQMDLINHYSVLFLDQYVRGKGSTKINTQLPGVAELREH